MKINVTNCVLANTIPVAFPVAVSKLAEPLTFEDRHEPAPVVRSTACTTDAPRKEDAPTMRPLQSTSSHKDVLAEAVGLQRDVEVSPLQMTAAAVLEHASGPDSAEIFQKIRQGALLLANDAQQKFPRSPLLETFARKLALKGVQAALEDWRAFVSTQDRVFLQSQKNLQSLVLRALRESFMISGEVLFDFAAKVRHHNKVKKKIRDQLTTARQTQANWAARVNPDQKNLFVSEQPFPWTEVDPVSGEYFVPTMTEEDVKRWQKVDEAAARDKKNSIDYRAFFGRSVLSGDERDLLKTAKKDKNGFFTINSANDDFIGDHLPELMRIIPKLNVQETEKYLPKMIRYLTEGWSNTDELKKLLGAMTPLQLLSLSDNKSLQDIGIFKKIANLSSIYPEADVRTFESVNSRGDSRSRVLMGDPIVHVRTAIDIVGKGKNFFGGEADRADLEYKVRSAFRALAEQAGVSSASSINPKSIQDVLGRLREKAKHPVRETEFQSSLLGQPKGVRTREELDSYIKKLEDDLNSVGDDAQLANVDLQNSLQNQQHTLQMMSSASKVLYDTALAIVRKVGA